MSKGHTWRKPRLYKDKATGESFVAVVTANDYHDSEKLPSLMEGIVDEVSQVSEDGDYDTFGCHDAIRKRAAIATNPLRKDANLTGLPHPRDQILQRIEQIGRKAWKQESGDYHRPSLAETTMFRLKVTFAGRVCSRTFDNQAVSLFLQCAALNRMIQVAKPNSYPVNG